MKPNLFIIGSMKAGTTYLRELLQHHPAIFMCEPKEPCHFVNPDQLSVLFPWAWRQGFWKSESRYLQLFASSGAATILGEASVFYSFMPMASGVAEKISRFNSDARLIYVIRDPIERTISHYWHNVQHFGENRSPSAAIIHDPQFTYVSDYAMQLAEYFKYFNRKQIKILTFEELTRSTGETIESVTRWLELEDFSVLPEAPPQNVTPDRFGRTIGIWRRLRRQNRLLRAAADRIPTSVRRLGARLMTREVSPGDVDLSEVVAYLRPLQQRQTEALTRLVGRAFLEWTTLNP
jgi:hypothetical protein